MKEKEVAGFVKGGNKHFYVVAFPESLHIQFKLPYLFL